uniref:Uncharacterized protein n=1 Tax=Candidatus Kentrum sp. LFY TaxID=2126342 RepID=A0A450WKL6_9GAMM|nr:MAG: hypothetical protein BECKLFY1418C_GA0070996_103322 [Candidatus Kentron sp. LFY]
MATELGDHAANAVATAFRFRYRKNKNPEETDAYAKTHPASVLTRSANMFYLIFLVRTDGFFCFISRSSSRMIKFYKTLIFCSYYQITLHRFEAELR